MKLVIERPKKEITIHFSGTIRRLLETRGINPETVLVVKNGNLATLDDKVCGNDTIRLLSVVSGG